MKEREDTNMSSRGHDHGHTHDPDDHQHGGHAHAHAPKNFGAAFAVGIALNLAFVGVEVVYGILANSVALLADAGHNLADVLGLMVAWAATVLARRRPSERFTYGLRGSSILAALFNGLVLFLGVGAIGWEALRRFADPQPVAGLTVMIVAAVGILINGVTAWLFMAGRKDDLNVRGAFLHMAADAAVSAGVVIAGLLIYFTGWLWLDAATSLAIVMVIIWSTWGLLRDAVTMSLAAVPPGVDSAAVREYLKSLPGVRGIHDLHIWAMGTTQTALTCHLFMPTGHPGDEFCVRTAADLHEKFKIEHSTLQIEISEHVKCALEPDNVI